MRALVTGSAGFLGRHFVDRLRRRGWFVEGWDIVNGWDCLDRFRTGGRYDLVVHAAAYEPHRAAIDGSPEHLARNLHLDAAMFSWAMGINARVLYLSSSAVYNIHYQMHGYPPLDEDDGGARTYEPDGVYGWAKLTGERMAQEARRAGLAVHIVRPFSGYGEDQDERFPFGAFAARARRHEDPFVIWGPGTQVRDWTHVDDVVAGALAIVEHDVREPVNLCTGIGTSMQALAAAVCEEAGYAPAFEFQYDRPAGVQNRVGNPATMLRYYEPVIPLHEGIKRALA